VGKGNEDEDDHGIREVSGDDGLTGIVREKDI
jgi:hypothetical protein